MIRPISLYMKGDISGILVFKSCVEIAYTLSIDCLYGKGFKYYLAL